MRNLKRALSLAVASVMLLGMMVVGSGAASYADVDAQDNLEAIEVLRAVGVMTGDDQGNFNPDQLVTRGEMAVMMCSLLDLNPGGSHPFTDVPAWANGYVAACYTNGITGGTSATTYGTDEPVTAVQAALMVMKALGYFGYQGEFGDSWILATVKQANEIDLYAGLNVYTEQALTRSEVAQMVLNALECTVMIVREEGGMSVDGNGISVSVKPTYTYTAAENNSGFDYDGGNDRTMQLCEKLYGKDLKKNTTTTDDFGRPANQWTYGTSVIKTPQAADLTYLDEVKGETIYDDLGKVSGVTLSKVYTGNTEGYTVDGVPVDDGSFAIVNGNTTKIGAKGTVTEVYYDKDTKVATIVCINYYLAQAAEDYDSSDEEVDITIFNSATGSATLSADDFAISGVKEDDYLIVTLADGTVKSIATPDTVENVVVDSARNNDYVVAGGDKYTYNAVAKASGSGALGQDFMADSSKYAINDDGYNLYLDPNGYVLGVEGYDAGVNLDDYLFVKNVTGNGFDGIAKVMFMDGTTTTVTVDKLIDGSTETDIDNSNAASKISVGFYKFDTDSGNNYELTKIHGSGTDVVTQGSDTTTITSAAMPLGSGYPAGTSATVFIADDRVYTGVKNAPEVVSSTVYYLVGTDGRLMAVYTATAGSSKTSSDDIVFVLNSNPARAKDGDDTYYVYDVIMNGEKTTLNANQNSKPAGVYALNTYTDGRADLGTRLALDLTNADDDLVWVLGIIGSADYKDGTLTLGSKGYILADDAKIFTIDGNTVKTISASGVKNAVAKDGFVYAAAVEVSSSDDDIVTVYLSKNAYASNANYDDINDQISSGDPFIFEGELPAGNYGSVGGVGILDDGDLTLKNAVVSGATLINGSVTVDGTTQIKDTLTVNRVIVKAASTLKIADIADLQAQEIVIEANGKIDLGAAGVYKFNAETTVVFGSGASDSFVNGVAFSEKSVSNTGILGMLQTAAAMGLLA